MQGLGAGRSAATTRALEANGCHRSPTIVVSDLCNVTSLMGHSFRHGVTAMQTLERLIIMGEANLGMYVGVGKLNEIKATKPTKGKLVSYLRHRFERWSQSEGKRHTSALTFLASHC
jgi:hypothetical protein